MGEIVGRVLLLVLAIYGTVEGIVRLSRWLWLPKGLSVAAVIPLRTPAPPLEVTLHRTTEELLRERGFEAVWFVDCGLTGEEKALSELLTQSCDCSPVISLEKLREKLQFL